MCTNRLPTKVALSVKHVRCDPTCVLCGIEPETIVHLFANCPFSRECWSEVDGGWRLGEVESIDEWVVEMWEVLPKTVLETVVVVCWALWEGRNAVVWDLHTVESTSATEGIGSAKEGSSVLDASWFSSNGSSSSALPLESVLGIVIFCSGCSLDCSSVCSDETGMIVTSGAGGKPGTRRKEGVSRLGGEGADHFEHWNPPLGLHLKVNIDVALDEGRGQMGFGWVVRDAESLVVGVGMMKSPGVYSVCEAETMGAREALSWIKKIGWTRIVLETDAQLVTNAVQKGLNITPFGAIIDDIQLLLGSIEDSSITFVRRSANETAHVLARKALCNRDFSLVEFFNAIPRCISATIAMH
ncbi:uncharacterized protein LOC116005672 [Ipomoea triloba]|uniref:uncharacterized protein LOC116005672 n=1 Tax=Ipomoea triloba TaxID=35885 RepID=UPI00125E6DAC|nr:uncharacterized protein LOC116005672 [Ipomoea triloba]